MNILAGEISYSGIQMAQSILNNKAQLFTTDMMVAVVLIALMLGLVMVFWTFGGEEINKRQERAEMQRAALDASSYLIKVVLVNDTNIFDKQRLTELVDCAYNQTRADFGLAGYEFYLNFSKATGGDLYIPAGAVICGKFYENSTDVVWTRRIGIYENKEVIMSLAIWK